MPEGPKMLVARTVKAGEQGKTLIWSTSDQTRVDTTLGGEVTALWLRATEEGGRLESWLDHVGRQRSLSGLVPSPAESGCEHRAGTDTGPDGYQETKCSQKWNGSFLHFK